MDSLTQFALGATVTTLCLGKKLGPRRAAILGGVLGTLPDLDMFLPFDDPVDSFVFHRGWTHALAVHAVAAPILGEILVRFVAALRDHRALTWLTVFLCLATHALIDAVTVYGTRLFWPFYPDPVGIGSIFIIDPLYTLPLLVVVIWALLQKAWSQRLGRWVRGAVMVSTAYMWLGIALQAHAEGKARAIFAGAGIEATNIFAIAAPFNIVVWKVIGLEEDRYHNLYLSLFDGDHDPAIYTHPRHPELTKCLGEVEAFEKLEWFSRGYYRAEMEGAKIVISDLRMGMTPNYVFQFAIAEIAGSSVQAIAPERDLAHRRAENGDWDWLLERVLGRPALRAAEKANMQPAAQLKISPC